MTKTSPALFARQVRQEFAKITWPTRKETVITTVMVMIISVIAAIFFLAADSVMSKLVDWILRLGA